MWAGPSPYILKLVRFWFASVVAGTPCREARYVQHAVGRVLQVVVDRAGRTDSQKRRDLAAGQIIPGAKVEYSPPDFWLFDHWPLPLEVSGKSGRGFPGLFPRRDAVDLAIAGLSVTSG
jgi:hypothetical protein